MTGCTKCNCRNDLHNSRTNWRHSSPDPVRPVAEMVRATGLNPESVRTELQRMKREGLLTSHPHPDKPGKRGGRPALYRLTDDPEARLALSDSLEDFYPPLPPTNRPTSRRYLWAQHQIDRAQTADDQQRRQLLSEAEQDLESAKHAEGGSLAPESVQAYLQFEHARIAYLRSEHDEAERIFKTIRESFVGIQDETTIKRIDEFLVCIQVQRHCAAKRPRGLSEAALARCLLDILAENAYQTDSPLIVFLLQLLQELSRTTGERIRLYQSMVAETPADYEFCGHTQRE